MTEFVLDGFSCRAEGSGDVLVMLFSGFDEQLFREVCGLVPDCRCVLAEFGEIDWDRDYSPWEASSGGRRFSGGAERLLAFLPDFTTELEKRFALWDEPRLCGAASCSGSTWFPGWLEFQRLHPLRGRIFLSLGGKEKNSPDPLMAQVEQTTMEVKRLAERSPEVTQTVFVHESGGHFSKVPQRIARGINGIIK